MLWNQAKWFIEAAIESREHSDEHVPDMKRLLVLLTEVLKPETMRIPVFRACMQHAGSCSFSRRDIQTNPLA